MPDDTVKRLFFLFLIFLFFNLNEFGNSLSGYDPVFSQPRAQCSVPNGELNPTPVKVEKKNSSLLTSHLMTLSQFNATCGTHSSVSVASRIKISLSHSAMGIGSAPCSSNRDSSPFQPTVGRALPSSPGSSTRSHGTGKRVRSTRMWHGLHFFSYIPLTRTQPMALPACREIGAAVSLCAQEGKELDLKDTGVLPQRRRPLGYRGSKGARCQQ